MFPVLLCSVYWGKKSAFLRELPAPPPNPGANVDKIFTWVPCRLLSVLPGSQPTPRPTPCSNPFLDKAHFKTQRQKCLWTEGSGTVSPRPQQCGIIFMPLSAFPSSFPCLSWGKRPEGRSDVKASSLGNLSSFTSPPQTPHTDTHIHITQC